MNAKLTTIPETTACFSAGALIHTKAGLKPIEKIQVGDWVLSKHESGEGERDFKLVTKQFVTEDRQAIMDGIGGKQADGNDKWSDLAVTLEHPIWVQGKGWKMAGDLKAKWPYLKFELVSTETRNFVSNVRLFVTDELGVAWVPMSSAGDDLSRVGSHLDVDTMKTVRSGVFVGIDSVINTHRVKPEHLYRTTVYNIEVEDFHTYYVGEAGVWVHDKKNDS